MAGIGTLPSDPIGGIGAALVAGVGGYMDKKEQLRVQNQQDEDRKRRQAREDFAFNRVQEDAIAQDEMDVSDLTDFANESIDPIGQAIGFLDIPANPGGLAPKNGLPMPGGSPVMADAKGAREVTVESAMTPEKQVIARQFKEIEGDYISMRNRVSEDIERIKAQTAGDPEAQQRRLAAYKRALDKNEKFKKVSAKYDGAMQKALEIKRTEASAKAVEAMLRGDTQALSDLGFTNEDGSPMKVIYNGKTPVGLETAMGPVRLRGGVTWALFKTGNATMEEVVKAFGEDQQDYDKMVADHEKVLAAKARRAAGGGSGSGGGGTKVTADIAMADEITNTQEAIAVLEGIENRTPEEQAKLNKAKNRLANLREQSKNSRTRIDQGEEKTDRAAAEAAIKSNINLLSKEPGRSVPNGDQLAQLYDNIKAEYGEEYAKRMANTILSSWGTQAGGIRKKMDEYWKSKSKSNGNLGSLGGDI